MRRLLEWSDWCEHSVQSWSYRDDSPPWCRECRNYVDGWRRAALQLPWWAMLAWAVASVVVHAVSP